MSHKDFTGRGKVAIVRTSPQTVLEDYARLMELANYRSVLPPQYPTLLKINISWQTWYPACSTAPWQLEGVIRKLQADGYTRLLGVHNDTVVVDTSDGERNNKQKYVTDKYNVPCVYIYKPEVKWVPYQPKAPFLVLDKIYPEGVTIPEVLIGNNIIQLPTVKCVHPATEIMLGDGSVTRIGDLVEARLKQGAIPLLEADGDLRVPAAVTLFGLQAWGAEPQSTAFFWRTPANGQPLWRVHTRTGREVTVSGEHPFRTPTGWRKASELQVGDRIAIPRRLQVPGVSQPLPQATPDLEDVTTIRVEDIPFRPGYRYPVEYQREVVQAYLDGSSLEELAAARNVPWLALQHILKRYDIPQRHVEPRTRFPEQTSPAFWRWMGYFLASGWVRPMRVTCRFWWTHSDPALRDDFFQLTRELFGLEVTCRPHSHDCYVDSVQLRDLFVALGLPIPLQPANKRLPALLFRCPDEEIAAFLNGYLDGKGSMGRRDGLHVLSNSEVLANQLQLLLTRLGIVAFRKALPPHAGRATMAPKRHTEINIYGDELLTLAQWVHFRVRHKQEQFEALIEHRKSGRRLSDWDTIPVDPGQFQRVRQELGFTQAATGHMYWVNAIEHGRVQPVRPVMDYFIELFRQADTEGRYREDIEALAALAHPAIAWDHVTAVETIASDTPYLYDFTMETTPSFVGNGIFLHNTHVFTTITGAMKNAFGGLLGRKRHWTHSVIHETLVDLLMIQQDIHPGLFAVMDGTFAGDGPGPRAMHWHEKNVLLASADQVAIDATSAMLQGFDPMNIPFIRIAHDLGLGVGNPQEIEFVGDVEATQERWHFVQEDTFASRGQKMIYHGALKPFEELLLRGPLVPWSYFASNFYHNVYWYPVVGRKRVQEALKTPWGQLFSSYGAEAGLEGAVLPSVETKTLLQGAAVLGGMGLALGGVGALLSRRRKS